MTAMIRPIRAPEQPVAREFSGTLYTKQSRQNKLSILAVDLLR
jgi:hypothetical protein